MAFDPEKHMIKVQGRQYLPVSARLIWFREEHPDWGIVTTPIEINLEKQYAIFSASIFNAEGKLMATATKMENVRGFPDYMEKAETGSVGRALAYCGFGTQFAPELEEGGRIADTSYPLGGNRPAMGANRPAPAGRPAGPVNSGFGNGGSRPLPGRPIEREAVPAPEDDIREAVAEERPAPTRPAVAPVARAAEAVDAREAPGDDEDPFADGAESPSARPAAPPVRAAAARANASSVAAAGDGSEASSATITGNRCSSDGCPAVLTQGQLNMSINKFGKALCPLHQREATPVANAGAKRNGAANPEMADTLL